VNIKGAIRCYPSLATSAGIFKGIWVNMLVVFQIF